ncbi:MAG: HesA/MoeB/ThiF family protein [Desulfobulbus sp.]|nr:MAG: HesA/MoeB/ThiF family protein [Desulfobulbus sp.]
MRDMPNITAGDDLFSRNIGTFTQEQQARLQKSKVTIIGCGGLGGYVISELARMGTGCLNLCDPDFFSPSNINRQLFATSATLGVNKALAAAEAVQKLHDRTSVHALPGRFQDVQNTIFAETDVVVDCLDSINSRLELAGLCKKKMLPLVHGAVYSWYGQTGVQSVNGNLIQQLYASQQAIPDKKISVIACTVAVVASIQAAETCKLLLDIPSPLRDNWMSIDLKHMTFDLAINA